MQCCDIRPSKRAPRTTVFSPFSLPNVLFATAVCNVATSDLRKVLGGQKFSHIFTSKCAFLPAACNVATRACHHSAILRDPTCEKCLRSRRVTSRETKNHGHAPQVDVLKPVATPVPPDVDMSPCKPQDRHVDVDFVDLVTNLAKRRKNKKFL